MLGVEHRVNSGSGLPIDDRDLMLWSHCCPILRRDGQGSSSRGPSHVISDNRCIICFQWGQDPWTSFTTIISAKAAIDRLVKRIADSSGIVVEIESAGTILKCCDDPDPSTTGLQLFVSKYIEVANELSNVSYRRIFRCSSIAPGTHTARLYPCLPPTRA